MCSAIDTASAACSSRGVGSGCLMCVFCVVMFSTVSVAAAYCSNTEHAARGVVAWLLQARKVVVALDRRAGPRVWPPAGVAAVSAQLDDLQGVLKSITTAVVRLNEGKRRVESSAVSSFVAGCDVVSLA